MNTQSTFDVQGFRAALGTFTTGVTIITTTSPTGEPVGVTVNSFNSVSLDPPLVLWCLAKKARSLAAFAASRHWNVHVLSADQEALSSRFARASEDKFRGVALEEGVSDAPLLPACTARFQCRTAFSYEGGDHVIFVGKVLRFDRSTLPPLAYQGGDYALASRKPPEGFQLGANPPPDSIFTEDLLGYLVGRAHYQLLYQLSQLLDSNGLAQGAFFILSVLSIRDRLTLEQINAFISYTDANATPATMAEMAERGLVAIDESAGELRYLLTTEGRQASLRQIALAKAVEQELTDKLGAGDMRALKLLLKRLIASSDSGVPDLWAGQP